MSENGFVKRKGYYSGIVYEWNIPTGSTCPFALECKVTVDRITGKFNVKKGAYRCYAASAERFPAVRKLRWDNYEYTLNGNKPVLPKKCSAVRIHMAGDFYNQAYFDMWLEVAKENPLVEFWAYTKSLKYWVNRIKEIPSNLVLTASYGGRNDELIEQYKLKNVKVYKLNEDTEGRAIDVNDDYARKPHINFALIDNFAIGKQKQKSL
jgi:hypothetical protein